jgi:hypothetical protein
MDNISSPYIKLFNNKGIRWHSEITDELMRKAENENKMLFIHIGFISSIYNRENSMQLFGDGQIVEILERNFISVIADKEEKPETFLLGLDLLRLDHDFSSGPINIFALPDKRPVTAFSLISPEGFIEIAENLTIAYNNKKEQVVKLAAELSEALSETGRILTKNHENQISADVAEQYFDMWKDMDFSTYFFNRLKPYTPDPNFMYLLEYSDYMREEKIEKFLINYLKHLHYSGAFDTVGGGFFRQTTDFSCEKPLFEKTLTENSHFLRFYSKAWKLTGVESFRLAALETFGFIKRELNDIVGGLYSSVTLLTPLKDSSYYFFSLRELQHLFPKKHIDIATILGFDLFRDDLVKQLPANGISANSALSSSEKIKLLERRSEHSGYYIDKRIITSYNCDAVNSLAMASRDLDNEDIFKFAQEKLNFIRREVIDTNKLICRCLCDRQKRTAPSLSDYAYYIQALLTIHKISADNAYLEEAKVLADTVISDFLIEESGMFSKSNRDEQILSLKRESNTDFIVPSVNSVMNSNLIELYALTGNKEYIETAYVQLNNIIPFLLNSGQMLLSWGAGLLKYLSIRKIIS